MNIDLGSMLGVGSVPVVLAVVQFLKPFIDDKRFYPLVGMIVGVAFNILVGLALSLPIAQTALVGILAGLGASGLYSFGSTLSLGNAAKK